MSRPILIGGNEFSVERKRLDVTPVEQVVTAGRQLASSKNRWALEKNKMASSGRSCLMMFGLAGAFSRMGCACGEYHNQRLLPVGVNFTLQRKYGLRSAAAS